MTAIASALAFIVLLVIGCSTAAISPVTPPMPAKADTGFVFGVDTFAFRNDIRARTPGKPDLYANYCFVMARAVRQFHSFARFDPVRPRLDRAANLERVRQVVAKTVWRPAFPPDDRVVIPGYRNLYEFSQANEALVKEGLGGRLLTWVHWTNWRIGLPVGGDHQEGIARRIATELAAGRLVQLLVTNWPIPELNHTVVAYAYDVTPQGIDFHVYDPNDPEQPSLMTFLRAERQFWATRIFYLRPGKIRAFLMYHRPLL